MTSQDATASGHPAVRRDGAVAALPAPQGSWPATAKDQEGIATRSSSVLATASVVDGPARTSSRPVLSWFTMMSNLDRYKAGACPLPTYTSGPERTTR